jgi:hypothetical protein
MSMEFSAAVFINHIGLESRVIEALHEFQQYGKIEYEMQV